MPEPLRVNAAFHRELRCNFVCAALLALFLVLIFLPGLNYPFLRDWDDGTFIIYNQNLSFTFDNFLLYWLEPYQDLYTPLPMYSFMIDRALFGLDPLGFRLHNLLLHFVGCYFLFLVARKLGARSWLAFAGALLWAANPQKVESVVWITERKDVLCGALAFASLWFFLRGVQLRRISFMAGILAALAIFAKPENGSRCANMGAFSGFRFWLRSQPSPGPESSRRKPTPACRKKICSFRSTTFSGIR